MFLELLFGVVDVLVSIVLKVDCLFHSLVSLCSSFTAFSLSTPVGSPVSLFTSTPSVPAADALVTPQT